MENHLLARSLELDGKRVEWNRERIKIFDTFIKESAYFCAAIERLMPNPSPLDEGDIVAQCMKGTVAEENAKSMVYIHLYGHAVRQANAIGILIEESCVRAGFQLWRSLFEGHVICDFLVNSCNDTPQVYRDYISHSLLRSDIRHKEKYNKLRMKKGREPYYDESEICLMRQIYKCKFGSLGDDYSWAKSILGRSPKFKGILDRTKSDLEIFYHLGSKEIHPTFGHRFVLAGVSLPSPLIPMMPIRDVFNLDEIYLDYLTAKPLVHMTSQIGDSLICDESMRQNFTSLQALGKDVLDKLAGESPNCD